MKISEVTRVYRMGEIGYEEREPVTETVIRGVVEEASLDLHEPSSGFHSVLSLKVNGKGYVIPADGLPRVDVGEEVILNIDNCSIVAIQIIRHDEVVFRALLPDVNQAYFHVFRG